MKLILVLFGLFAMATGKPNNEFQEHIDIVNSMKTTWKAGHNFGKYIDLSYIKGLCGAISNPSLRQSLPGKITLLNNISR